MEEKRRNLDIKQIVIGLLTTSIIEDNGTIFSRVSKNQAKPTLKPEKQNINSSDNLQA